MSVRPFLLVLCVALPALSGVAFGQQPDEAEQTPYLRSILDRVTSGQFIAQGAGAVAGIALFNYAIAPSLPVGVDTGTLLLNRIAAMSVISGSAVGASLAYDWWHDDPINYAYIRRRAGFIAGVAAAFGVSGALGYEMVAGSDWLSWLGYRAVLIGSGNLGGWAAEDIFQGLTQ